MSVQLKYYEGEMDEKYNAYGKQIKYGNGYLAVDGISFEFKVDRCEEAWG